MSEPRRVRDRTYECGLGRTARLLIRHSAFKRKGR